MGVGSGRAKRPGKEEELAEALYGHVRESLLGGLKVVRLSKEIGQ